MGCDFKPGDEVVCIEGKTRNPRAVLPEGPVFTVAAIVPLTWADGTVAPNDLRLELVEAAWDTGYPHIRGAYHPRRFRKVQKRNDRLTIEAFSVIKDGGFEEPKRRAPAKRRERA